MAESAAVRAAQREERRQRALEMRRTGATFEQIARKLDYRNPAEAARDITKMLTSVVRETSEEVRAVELARLDGLMVTLWPSARRGDLQAVDRVLKVMERRAKLLGLDAAQKHEIVTQDAIEQEIKRLETEMSKND